MTTEENETVIVGVEEECKDMGIIGDFANSEAPETPEIQKNPSISNSPVLSNQQVSGVHEVAVIDAQEDDNDGENYNNDALMSDNDGENGNADAFEENIQILDESDVGTQQLDQQQEEEEKDPEIQESCEIQENSEKENGDQENSEIQENAEDLDDDDDFGSFDEASFDEFQEVDDAQLLEHPNIQTQNIHTFDSLTFQEPDLLSAKIQTLVDQLLPTSSKESQTTQKLLSANASFQYKQLSKIPRLNPPNWIKLKIRHNLLVKLGVAINLDELERPQTSKINRSRKKSVSEKDLDFSSFDIPDLESLNLSPETKDSIQSKTHNILATIESQNLTNTSEIFLSSTTDQILDAKLAQLKENYDSLVTLGSIWQAELDELRDSQQMYESVVQNMVGYSQKLQRNQILEKLSKSKKGKRVF